MNKDIIFIKQLNVSAIIGIYDWERKTPQPLIFDIEMTTNIQKSASTDSIADTVCYKTVADNIIDLTKQNKFELLESLAEKICQLILAKHQGVLAIKLSVNKPNAVENTQTVGISIYRSRR
jgi:dihydroneopterin aldolase